MDWMGDAGAGLALSWARWLEDLTDLILWTTLGLLVALLAACYVAARGRIVRQRGFWCPWRLRTVEAEFAEDGFPGCRRPAAVTRCSAFEPSTAIACERHCLRESVRQREPLPFYRAA